MHRAILYFLEMIGLFGLLGMMVYITWTKMILGAVLSLVGAFFPRIEGNDSKDRGSGNIDFGKIAVRLAGGVRVLVVIGGIILIIGSILDGHEGYVDKKMEDQARIKSIRDKEIADIFEQIKMESAKSDDRNLAAAVESRAGEFDHLLQNSAQ